MNIDEALSRLLAGDLPDDEARALRARVAAEPELAARLAGMVDLIGALEALPDAMTPPPLRPRVPVPAPRRARAAVAGWAVAAAVGLAWLVPSPEAARVLESGAEWIHGEAVILAGDARVEVDGRARIFVEPPQGVARGAGHQLQEESMSQQTILAALAGSAVTIAVYEGSAVVWSDRHAASPVSLSAGQTLTVPPSSGPTPSAPEADPSALLRDVDRLAGELEEARARLAEAEFTGAVARGQLVAHQGVPASWPADVPEPMRRENFEVELSKQIEGMPGFEVSHVDCDEYPCLAAIRYVGPDAQNWQHPLEEQVGLWTREVMGDDLSLSVSASQFNHDGKMGRFVIFGAHQGGRDEDVGQRTKFRMDQLVDQIGQEVADEPEMLRGLGYVDP